ncbi:MAG TPA: NfeD family protein [Ohtaekwangia sp.]|nr:NfeD family protein [Ohtaekwangia sp.]
MWIIILALLAIGLSLIIVELVFIPGTTIVGLLGLAFTIVGIVISYDHFGRETGLYILIGTAAMTAVALVYSFRSGAWTKFSLKTAINSKVNEGMTGALQAGDEGVTVSTLRPIGKALFNDQTFEVKTSGNYVEQGQRVRITHIDVSQIIVEPLN